MTAPTHKQYSVSFAFLATMLLYTMHSVNINYYFTLLLMLLVSKQGALFPDVDHSWQNVKEKTIPNFIINKAIHLTGGHHRSWQTHSLDIVTIFTLVAFKLPQLLYNHNIIGCTNRDVLSILLIGFAAGWISHMIADMMTSAGVRVLCFLKFKVALVPKKIFKLRFNTGHEWENFCFKAARIINVVLGVFCLAYPFILNNYMH